MDTNGNTQTSVRNRAVEELYANITMRLSEYKMNRMGCGDERKIVDRCMDIVEQEARKLWKEERERVIVHFIEGDMGEFPNVAYHTIRDGIMVLRNEDGTADVICLKNTFQVSVV